MSKRAETINDVILQYTVNMLFQPAQTNTGAKVRTKLSKKARFSTVPTTEKLNLTEAKIAKKFLSRPKHQ